MALSTKIPIGILMLFTTALFGGNHLTRQGIDLPALQAIRQDWKISSDTLHGIVNVYTPVVGFGCDSSILQVGNTNGFSASDCVLMIQMQGAEIQLTDNFEFGQFTNLGTAGNYEFNRIQSINGNEIQLKFDLVNKYSLTGKIQLVRVPEYDNATVGALTCQPWDGTTGGVLAIAVQNILELVDNPDVSGLGFRGGAAQDATTLAFQELHYFYPPNATFAGAKGEGIAIVATQQSYGRGNAGNGGGGGNAHNAGGGGGANGGYGGQGGLDYFLQPNEPTLGTNGLGGLALAGDIPIKVVMGGGGGAGHVNDNAGASGGNGGGIILFKANTIIGNNFSLLARGKAVRLPEDVNAKDGQGGGGAGGTIMIEAATNQGTFTCDVQGGSGGDCLSTIPNEAHGPGGGGSGGQIGLSFGLNNVNVLLNGGLNGVANQANPNGAQAGGVGKVANGIFLNQANKIAQTQPTTTKYVVFCPGTTIIINGKLYTQPDTITGIIPAPTGCDTLATYILQFAFQPSLTKYISFCKGDTVLVQGEPYTEPQTVTRTISTFVGCDTLVNYILSYIVPNEPTHLNLSCPASFTVDVAPNENSAIVNYASPSIESDCPCPGIDLSLKKGLLSAANFPLGATEVCYAAKDSCGNTQECCFTVTVGDGEACDVKTNGCIKFELLSITQNTAYRKTYRIRLINNCSSKLSYLAIELPKGITASDPLPNTVYTAPGGHTYFVRNPAYSPSYSLRFASRSDSIRNGQSDIFQYTLPALANPVFIHVVARLEPQIYYEAHLNVFDCNVTFAPQNSIAERQDAQENPTLFPNPTSGRLYTDLSAWNTESVQLRIYNIHGKLIQQTSQTAELTPCALDLPLDTPDGVYLLEIVPANGRRVVQRFVFQNEY